MVDYHRHVAEIHRQHAQALYDETKDLRIEYRFWQPFYFDFYHHLVYLRFINKREAPVVQMKSIDTYELGKLPGLELKQMITDLKRMGLEQLMEFRKPWNNEIICQFYASYHLDTQAPPKASTTRLISLPFLTFLAWTIGIVPPLPSLRF